MELHNTMEDTVIARVNEIFEIFKQERNPDNYCTCDQCRMDTVCFVLNRVPPHYILSHRGAARVQRETLEQQQQVADVTALIYEGLKKVNHNLRHNSAPSAEMGSRSNVPVFNIPTIIGRLFNGNDFAPLSDAVVELLWNGELVAMKDRNWQNPCSLASSSEGTFSFWPAPAESEKIDTHKIFEYTLRVSSPGFETMLHFFKIPVASEIQEAGSFTLNRTFKLPDLYLFPPGEAEQNG